MTLEFCRFFREQLDAKELTIAQVPEFIERETGYVITVQQAYEFLDTKRESCPSSAMVKVWERAFRINLAPRYYGADQAFAKGTKAKK